MPSQAGKSNGSSSNRGASASTTPKKPTTGNSTTTGSSSGTPQPPKVVKKPADHQAKTEPKTDGEKKPKYTEAEKKAAAKFEAAFNLRKNAKGQN